MALDLGDLDGFLDGGMYFTIAGKRYRIPPVSGALGLWGRRMAVARGELTDLSDDELAEAAARIKDEVGPPPFDDGVPMEEAMLGAELVAELVADGVDDEALQRLSKVVYGRIIGGDDLALHIFRGEEAPKANRATRRAAAKAVTKALKASASRTTSTAGAGTTRKAASGKGTNTPTKSAATAKAASRGRKS